MSLPTPALPGHQCVVQRSEMARPDISREAPEMVQRSRFIEQEIGQTTVPFAQIAGRTGGHYVAAGAVAAADLGLHVIHGQRCRRELFAAVHAAPVVPGEDFFAVH